MLLSKSTPNLTLKYNIDYENENARLLIADAIESYDAVIKINPNVLITVETALLIWNTVSEHLGHRFTIAGRNSFGFNLEKKVS